MQDLIRWRTELFYKAGKDMNSLLNKNSTNPILNLNEIKSSLLTVKQKNKTQRLSIQIQNTRVLIKDRITLLGQSHI